MNGYRHALIRVAVVAGAATAAALVALPGTASAATPKATCNLVVDPLHDTAPAQLDAPHLDIKSADVATGQTTVVGVVRVRDLGSAAASVVAGGRWDLSFGTGGSRYTFTLRVDPFGAAQPSFTRDPGTGPVPAGPVSVVVNGVTNTITWTVPRTSVVELPPTPDRTTVLGGFVVRTYAGPADLAADAASSAGQYLDGTPSCVRAY